jgi:hypothetical protein
MYEAQKEQAFKAALDVAKYLSENGADEREVVAAAKGVVAAGFAAADAIDGRKPVARATSDGFELLGDSNIPVGSLLYTR